MHGARAPKRGKANPETQHRHRSNSRNIIHSINSAGFRLLHSPVHCIHRGRSSKVASKSTQLPLQLLGSVHCAPHSLGASSLLPHRGLGIGAWLHREADRVAKRPAKGFAHRISLRGHRCRGKGFREQKKIPRPVPASSKMPPSTVE